MDHQRAVGTAVKTRSQRRKRTQEQIEEAPEVQHPPLLPLANVESPAQHLPPAVPPVVVAVTCPSHDMSFLARCDRECDCCKICCLSSLCGCFVAILVGIPFSFLGTNIASCVMTCTCPLAIVGCCLCLEHGRQMDIKTNCICGRPL